MGAKNQGKRISQRKRSPQRPSEATQKSASATPFRKRTLTTFFTLLKPLIPAPERPVAAVTLNMAPLAHLGYHNELLVKGQALGLLWKHCKLPGVPEPVVGSSRHRYYRTTTKRRALYKGGSLFLMSGDGTTQKKTFLDSPLEPAIHKDIYLFLQKKLSEPTFKLLAQRLNYLIIRGSYQEQAVIFNVDQMSGPIVRKLKILAEHVQKQCPSISAAYVYLDPSRSDYYLEERQPANLLNFKKLYGNGFLSVSHGDCKYSFHPTSFSQVNESIVPLMLERVKELLAPTGKEALLDLYCGYGLFSHYLAGQYVSVLGIDAEGPSIRSAMHNKKLNPASRTTRFTAERITEKGIDTIRPQGVAEVVILDPPRKGPVDGVIAAIGRRAPQKVLHIFCSVDQISPSVSQWIANGYQVERVVPLDMFPGTANLEVLVLLTRNLAPVTL